MSKRLQMYDLNQKYERLKTIYDAIPKEERRKAWELVKPKKQAVF